MTFRRHIQLRRKETVGLTVLAIAQEGMLERELIFEVS